MPRPPDRGSILVRLWCEPHDPTLRGAVIDVAEGTSENGYGVAELLAILEQRLRKAEAG